MTEDYKKVGEEWKRCRLDYLKVRLRHEVLEDLLINKCGNLGPDVTADGSLLKRITMAVCGRRQDETKRPLEREQLKAVKEAMFSSLLDRCTALLSHWNLPDQNESSDYQRAKHLPELIRTDLETLREQEQTASEAEMLKVEAERQNMLKNHVETLNQLCGPEAQAKEAASNRLLIDYVAAKAKTLELKVKSLELEALALTYNRDATKALDKMRKELNDAIEETNKDIARVKGELERYQTVGPAFDTIVDDYVRIQKDIEGKEWALQELKSSNTT